MELTDRQRIILKTVVEDYVMSATPVPSERIARRPGMKVSSATVRSELVELEEMGLLSHPHTSAGRVPSDLGYRFYIEHLMAETVLTPMEQKTVRHQFHQVEADLDEWVPLAASVMAQMAHSAALVTRLRSRENRVKRLELVSVQDDVTLVVLILRCGSVQQRMLRLAEPVSRDELIKVANRLSDLLENKSLPQVVRRAAKMVGLERELALLLCKMLEQSETSWVEDIYYEGIDFVSGEPEFERADRIIELMDSLHRGSKIEPLLSEVVESAGTRVVIGSENLSVQMRGCSVVLQRYGPIGQGGVLGVLGPTRMRYWRAVSMVRFMAELLDNLVEQSAR